MGLSFRIPLALMYCYVRFMHVSVQDDSVVEYFAPYTLLWFKQYPGMCGGKGNLSFSRGRKKCISQSLSLSLSPFLSRSCFIYVYLCLRLSPCLLLSVHHIYNCPHLFCLSVSSLYALISPPDGLSFPIRHLAPSPLYLSVTCFLSK